MVETTTTTKPKAAKLAEQPAATEQPVVAVEAGLPVQMDFMADAGMGMEEADKSSFAIPFIIVLQANSPQLEKLDDAKAGMLMNSITEELFKSGEGVHVIPVSFQRRYLRWSPRSSGGGYKGEYNPIEVETGKIPGMSIHRGMYLMDVPEGVTNPFDADGRPLYDHLSDTRNHFILFQTKEGSWQPALISMASTQIKKSKRWMSRIQGVELTDPKSGRKFNPPSFSHVYLIKTELESNQKGKWYGLDINMAGAVTDPQLYQKAKDFNAQVMAGKVEVSQPADEADTTGNSGDDDDGKSF
ncbi:MAG TPA: hypothetical protein VFM18_23085 [Methanosarcina sp.]|nr:hypothetical protein [Methanosarcina sp.]